ncbi:MAG: Xaa-Pro peptidase family protein [Fimbriimonadaceae bacterium]
MTHLQRLRRAMAEEGVTALLLSHAPSVRWATGFTGSTAWAIVTPSGGVFVTDSRYTVQAAEEVAELPVVSFGQPKTANEFLGEQVRALGVGELWFESAFVTHKTWSDWTAAWPDVRLTAAPNLLGPLRLVKSPEEIAKIRRACELADACMQHAFRMIQPGVTEYDINLDIEFFIRRHGAEIAFPPIVVSGERSARPHGRASEKPLAAGDFVTVDLGAKLDGYCSDITRTVAVGKASDRHREVYQSVLEAQLAALEGMRPGMTSRQADALARETLARHGLDRYFGHGLGHGLGTEVHDGGVLNPSGTDVLAPGQVWTVEPGVYIPGFGGVRIEDDVVLNDDGLEVLTHTPKELLELS